MDAALRELVWRRAASRCEYCRMPQHLDPLPFQIDHVIARKHHGLTTDENLAMSCFECNTHKGPNVAGIDPQTGGVVPLFHPRRDTWEDH
ncbi:MAG: HNH endonuclease [Planctomycetes bacterium]|nr:HNH endonuclease [Planctomycetota bacterium]